MYFGPAPASPWLCSQLVHSKHLPNLRHCERGDLSAEALAKAEAIQTATAETVPVVQAAAFRDEVPRGFSRTTKSTL